MHVAVCLAAAAGVDPARIAIVDPAPLLLARWRHVVANTGMTHLRSPGVHHLDVEPWSLHRFAGVPAGRGRSPLFAAPYDRPAVALFQAHADAVVARHGLAERHVQAHVRSADPDADGVTLGLDDGSVLRAERVVLALGLSDQPSIPGWARGLAGAGLPVHHVLCPSYALEPEGVGPRVVVVGAGISGAQVALRLAGAGRDVTLVTRHPLREHLFDSDPGWLGPRFMAAFAAERDPDRRRAAIRGARHRGSLPHEVRVRLAGAVRDGRIRLAIDEVDAVGCAGRVVSLRLRGGDVEADTVLLATGYESMRPGGPLTAGLVERYGLRVASCGHPLVDAALRWHPRLHVVGPLAELELGPTARNIAGARRAAERIVTFVISRAERNGRASAA